MAGEQFIGVWKLVSAEYRRANGDVVEIYGANPAGMLMYDANGNMSVHLMRRDRPKFAVADRLGGTPEQIQAAFRGYLAYFGKYSIDDEKQTVTHHIEGCTLPNWIGVDQVRYFDLNDNRLTLRTPPLTIGEAQATGYLVWEKDQRSSNHGN
jgi:hypothetical protein